MTTPFALHGGVRRDDSPAHEALREALVNALIHADYNGAGGIVIERRPDGFMLGNPGMLLVSLDQYRTGGVSECRNRALQQMFLMIGGGERAGSGADKIRSGWTSRSWRVPWITEGTHPDRVRLALTMVSLIPPDTLEGLRRRFGRETVDSLTREELHALATAELEGSVTNARLRSLTTLHPADITKLLQGLCDRGLLEPDGYGRWTSYHLPDSGEQRSPGQRSGLTGAIGPSGNSGLLDANSGLLETNSGLLEASSGLLEASSGLLESSSGLLESSSGPLESSSGLLESNSGPLGSPAHRSREARRTGTSTGELGLSEDEEYELRAIAEPVAGKGKAPKSDVERVIIELCFGRFLSIDQLSKLLDRSARRLRKDHLSPLVRSGRLHFLHPEAPSSPNQAYTATRQSQGTR